MSDWHCWIAGSPQRSRERYFVASLHAQARLLGVADRISFLGERRDVPRLMAAADVHCQPNHVGEPFGNVFIEALCAGTPSVTSALGGALEIIDDTCGRLVPPRDPEALANALQGLMVGDSSCGSSEVLVRRAEALCAPEVSIPKLHAAYAAAIRNRNRAAFTTNLDGTNTARQRGK